MRLSARSTVSVLLGALVFVLPPYVFERLAEYYFLQHSALFFIFSGYRLYFDIGYALMAGWLLGHYIEGLGKVWLTVLLSTGALMALFYFACEPRLCYSFGPDGLEPLRLGSFLAAEGLLTAHLGSRAWVTARDTPFSRAAVGFATVYAVGYFPVVFTLAGAKMLSPFSPYSTYALLFFLCLTVSLSLREGTGERTAVVAPVLSVGLLLLLGSAITLQYLGDAIALVDGALAFAALGSAAGALLGRLRGSRGAGLPVLALVAAVLLMTLVVQPDAVIGRVAYASNAGAPSSYASATPLYAGAFMSSEMVRPFAVAVNVSVPASDAAALQGGNYLAAGMGVHSADCCTDGIDYGYRFDVVVAGNGSERVVASAWKVCDANAACGGHSWKVLLYYNSSALSARDTGSLMLELRWENHTVIWEYWSGETHGVAGSFLQSSRANGAFNAGWFPPPAEPGPGGALFFQVGVSSLAPLQGNWSATFACPSYNINGTWQCTGHEETTQGSESFWKVLWRWGEDLPNAGFTAVPTNHTISFHRSSSTMASYQIVW